MPISPPNGYTVVMNPTQLGPYEILSRLGRGGMGAVYEAIDTTSGDAVAVKVLASHLADDPGLRARFDAEIETLKNLRHPGIVRLLSFGEQDDQPFFAMELVRGKSLEQILRGGRRFTWRETVAVALEVTRALKAAHDQGIVHRDLKPANLLVAEASSAAADKHGGTATADGAGRVTVKLADFGIAKLFGGVAHTALGHVVGTAEYMAPEQAVGRPVDHRVDLYALGLVMFAMLTGSPPFRGTQLTEVIDKQRRTIPPRVASLVPTVPAELDELIARLLSKDPAQRPASALALGRLLAAIETLHPPDAEASVSSADKNVAPTIAASRQGPTAHERSNKPTSSAEGIDATGRVVAPGKADPGMVPPRPAGREVDLLAATQPLPNPIAPSTRPKTADGRQAAPPRSVDRPPAVRKAQPTAGNTDDTRDFTGTKGVRQTAASVSESVPARLPTDVASATTQVDRSPRNQFTTIAEVERAAADKARREQRWQLLWQGITSAAIAAALGGAAWTLLQPPSADQVYERIMAVANDDHGDLRDVRDDMDLFLDKHAGDTRAGRIRDLKRTLDLDLLERRARRRSRGDKGITPLERDYRAAMNDEEHGPSACMKSLEAMLAVHGSGSASAGDAESGLWLDLARRKLDQLRPLATAEQRDDSKRIGELLADAASLASRAGIANDEAARRSFAAQRRTVLQNIVEVYADRPHAAEAVAFARQELGAGDATQPSSRAAAPPTPNTQPDPSVDSEAGNTPPPRQP